MRSELTAGGFEPSAVRYGVRSFRLVYRTVDSRGRPTTASGLMVLPTDGARRLTVVSYTHGTETYRGDAPSMQPSGFEPAPAYTFASAGFAVSDPDYLGLGTGSGLQPYLDLPSETTAARPHSGLAGRCRTARTRGSGSARWPRSAGPTTCPAPRCPPSSTATWSG